MYPIRQINFLLIQFLDTFLKSLEPQTQPTNLTKDVRSWRVELWEGWDRVLGCQWWHMWWWWCYMCVVHSCFNLKWDLQYTCIFWRAGRHDSIPRRTRVWSTGIAQPSVPLPCFTPHFSALAPRMHTLPLGPPSNNYIPFLQGSLPFLTLYDAYPCPC